RRTVADPAPSYLREMQWTVSAGRPRGRLHRAPAVVRAAPEILRVTETAPGVDQTRRSLRPTLQAAKGWPAWPGVMGGGPCLLQSEPHRWVHSMASIAHADFATVR